jgi:hypothetical protein
MVGNPRLVRRAGDYAETYGHAALPGAIKDGRVPAAES